MESVPYADGLQYLAAISSFSDNFKVDTENLIIQEPEELFETTDEEFQDYFNVQEEVVVQECPEQEIGAQSWNIEQSSNINAILAAEVECMSSSVDVDNVEIPIPEGEEASSVNPYPCDFCSQRFSRKSHLMNHLVTHQSEGPYCCALCGVRYRHKCDLANHMNIHVAPDDQAENVTESQNASVSKAMNKLMFVDPIQRCSVTPGEDTEVKGDNDQNTKSCGRGRGRGRGREKGLKDRPMTLGWNSRLSKPHTCNPCEISFTREKALLNHARVHHTSDDINIITTQNSKLCSYDLTILSSTASNRTYPCESCSEVFQRFDFLKRHQRQHTQKEHGTVEEEAYEEAHMCIHCGLFFKSMSDLEMHTEQHLVSSNIAEKSTCLICNETFDSTDELSDHMSQMHNDSLSENLCKVCGKQCKDAKALQKHLLIHGTSDNKCKLCGKRFNSRARFQRHMIIHRERVVCGICREEVADKQALINHKAIHANTSRNSLTKKVFPCTSCGKVFGSRSSQQIHTRIHTGERPYDCRYCDKAFADGGTLRKHERIHTGEKPYVCPVCPKAFNQRVVLREHIRAHHTGYEARGADVNFYECKVCRYLFRTATELCSHLVQHSDENTAKCRVVPVGPRKYKSRSKLGNRKDTLCVIQKVFTVTSGQSETESCEDDPMPSVEEQAVQSIMDGNDQSYSPEPVVSPKSSPVKTYKIVNGKVMKQEPKAPSKPVSQGSKCIFSKPELKKQSFIVKEGHCSRTCAHVSYFCSKMDPETFELSFGEESNENNNPDEQDQISVEDIDLSNIKTEINDNDESEFEVQDYENIGKIEYTDQAEMEYYIPDNDEFDSQGDTIMEAVNDNCLIETELVFDLDYVEEVGANIELSTEEMVPVYLETISCDICDEIFEDRKELMKHIQTMHIG